MVNERKKELYAKIFEQVEYVRKQYGLGFAEACTFLQTVEFVDGIRTYEQNGDFQ